MHFGPSKAEGDGVELLSLKLKSLTQMGTFLATDCRPAGIAQWIHRDEISGLRLHPRLAKKLCLR
jgi:hypothetical protein